MKIRVGLAAAAVMAIAIPVWAHCGFCGSGKKSEHSRAHAEVGKPAPDFALTDVDGKEHKLSALKGKVVVLEWTNHTCPFVRRHQSEERTMQKTFAKFGGKPVAWLAIDSSHFCAEKRADIKSWIKDKNIAYPILLDPKGEIGHMYGAKTTPHMFVIDQKGVLAYAGAIDNDRYGEKETKRNYVEEAVTALLNGSAVAVASTKSYGCGVKYAK